MRERLMSINGMTKLYQYSNLLRIHRDEYQNHHLSTENMDKEDLHTRRTKKARLVIERDFTKKLKLNLNVIRTLTNR
jgi:hypothetical protein